jgi:hypothetical protein
LAGPVRFISVVPSSVLRCPVQSRPVLSGPVLSRSVFFCFAASSQIRSSLFGFVLSGPIQSSLVVVSPSLLCGPVQSGAVRSGPVLAGLVVSGADLCCLALSGHAVFIAVRSCQVLLWPVVSWPNLCSCFRHGCVSCCFVWPGTVGSVPVLFCSVRGNVVQSCFVLHFLSCPVQSSPVLSRFVLLCPFQFSPVLSGLVLSGPVLACALRSGPFQFGPVRSCPVLSLS